MNTNPGPNTYELNLKKSKKLGKFGTENWIKKSHSDSPGPGNYEYYNELEINKKK